MKKLLILGIVLPLTLFAQENTKPRGGKVMSVNEDNKPMTAAQKEAARRKAEQRKAELEALKKKEAAKLAKAYVEAKAKREAAEPKVMKLDIPVGKTETPVKAAVPMTSTKSQANWNITPRMVIDAINQNCKGWTFPRGSYNYIATDLNGDVLTIQNKQRETRDGELYWDVDWIVSIPLTMTIITSENKGITFDCGRHNGCIKYCIVKRITYGNSRDTTENITNSNFRLQDFENIELVVDTLVKYQIQLKSLTK